MPNKEQEITQIGNSITIKGDILGKSDVRVAGNVQGSVNIEGDLVVERTGRIEGEIKVKKVLEDVPALKGTKGSGGKGFEKIGGDGQNDKTQADIDAYRRAAGLKPKNS